MAKTLAAPPVIVVLHIDEACSAEELEEETARW
jgi:hypothetical protein